MQGGKFVQNANHSRCTILADELKARAPQSSIASWAFRFCGSLPRVLTILSGMTCMEHLDDNLRTFTDFKPLDATESGLLDYSRSIEAVRQADHCISCGQCQKSCPQHIRIPAEPRRIDEYLEKLNQGKSDNVTNSTH